MDREKREQRLIQILSSGQDYITCRELAGRLQISMRSIRYLISKINEHGMAVESSPKGYRLLSDLPSQFPAATSDSNIPSTAGDRQQYIYERLIIHGKILNIEELCDYFCISPVTFRNELGVWRKNLLQYNLYLKTKAGKIYSVGNDRDKQAFAFNIIRDELKHSGFSLENLQHFFHMTSLADIRHITLEVLSRYQYFLDDYSLLTYALHLALIIEIDNKTILPEASSSRSKLIKSFTSEMITVISEIVDMLKAAYPEASFSWEDIAETSLLMTTRISF